MTSRERMIETLLFGAPDRVPLVPGMGRESTLKVWHEQGLPQNVDNVVEYAYRQAGGTLPWPANGKGFPINSRMMPQFEEKVLEEKDNSRVVQDWKGNVCEIGKEYTPAYLREAFDFCTRRWIKCPVESWADWENMKHRYNPASPERYPDNPEKLGRELADRDNFLEIHFSGPFWQLREWVGFEGLCMMFYDDPDLVRDMVRFWEDFIAGMLENILKYVTPDSLHLSEDMAYKSFSMISPQMVEEFLLPTYQRWGQIVRDAGVPLYGIDSDGYMGELIPVWLKAGVNFCDPIEVAAGNDINAFRREFGHKMAYRGGVDKRAMARGGETLENEIERLRPVVEDGGFVPGCDHGVPSDVSWPNFVKTVGLLARITGWL